MPERPLPTEQEVLGWIRQRNNWGRWGKDDQLGALNFITPAKRREAMALAKDGIVVSLEQPLKVVAFNLGEQRRLGRHCASSSRGARR